MRNSFVNKAHLGVVSILFCVLSLTHSFGQEYQKEQLVGKWVEHVFSVTDSCSIDTIPVLVEWGISLEELLSDSLIMLMLEEEVDTNYWEYEYKANGLFVENDSGFCDGHSYQAHGKWDYKNGEFAKLYLDSCSNRKRNNRELHYYPIQWISPNAFYECGEEGPGNHLVIIHQKLPGYIFGKQ